MTKAATPTKPTAPAAEVDLNDIEAIRAMLLAERAKNAELTARLDAKGTRASRIPDIANLAATGTPLRHVQDKEYADVADALTKMGRALGRDRMCEVVLELAEELAAKTEGKTTVEMVDAYTHRAIRAKRSTASAGPEKVQDNT